MGDSEDLLTRMLVSAINAREQESNRISRTLHDEVGQVLSAVGLQLHALKLEFQGIAPEIATRTSEIQEMLERAMTEVRALSYDLNPAVVERVGLQNALDRLVGRQRHRFEGTLRFQFDPNVRVPLPIGNALYKIAEHALENALTHSGSRRIEVGMKNTRGGSALEVRDHGLGFAVEDHRAKAPGLGLLLMEHYADRAGLQLTITSTPGKGTTVRALYTPEGQRDVGTPKEAD
jgi:signal transduction histidine kinase